MKPSNYRILGDLSGEEENCMFEWFRERTSKKLPGVFESEFWDKLILRVSFTEPAVMHAVLALGSMHKRETIEDTRPEVSERAPDQHERFALRHYSKAIGQLQGLSVQKNKASVRVALVACMAFTCLEIIRGHLRTGVEHLRLGMRLLSSLTDNVHAVTAEILSESADQYLRDAFSQMNIQAIMLGQGTSGLDQVPRSSSAGPLPVLFHSMKQARKRLDWLIGDVLYLKEQLRISKPNTKLAEADKLQTRWHQLQTDVIMWQRTFNVSRTAMLKDMGPVGQPAHVILSLHYHMLHVAAATCCHPDGEMAYDYYNDNFVDLIRDSSTLSALVRTDLLDDTELRFDSGLPHFIFDRGWVAPLYFAATKCRNHRIRVQCIKLLSSVHSKEGLWDGWLAAIVAQEIANIEEGGFYEGFDNGFDPKQVPAAEELDLPILPESRRIEDFRITLPNSPLDKTCLICQRGDEIIRREYDPRTRIWNNSEPEAT